MTASYVLTLNIPPRYFFFWTSIFFMIKFIRPVRNFVCSQKNRCMQFLFTFHTDFLFQNILRSADNVDLSDYYYMWCVGHFISFCKPNLVPMHILQEVLSTDVFSFLIFKGVESCEQIVMATKNKMAVNQLVRKYVLTTER